MNNQEQHQYRVDPQEIDLVDVTAVLWRRKVVVMGVAFICFAVSLVLFMPKSKSTISTLIMVGEISNVIDGNQVLQQTMSPIESRQVLESVFLPKAIRSVTQDDDQLFNHLSGNITVNSGNDKKSSDNLILISSSISDLYVESITMIFHSATAQLLELQNKTYKIHQDRMQRTIIAKELDLKKQIDSRMIESEKLSLKIERFLNEQEVEKSKDNVLQKHNELKYQELILTAKKKYELAKRTLAREEQLLKKHDQLIPILELKKEYLEGVLVNVIKKQESLLASASGNADKKENSILMDAMMAMSNSSKELKEETDTISRQILIDLPLARTNIEFRIDSLESDIILTAQKVVVAEEELAVFLLEIAYRIKALKASSENIAVRFSAFDAVHEAKVSQLEEAIISLQLLLIQSTPSEVLAPPTKIPSPKQSIKTIAIGALFAGGIFGCFVAFFLELFAKAKVRAAETANV